MKILFDQNLSRRLVSLLSDLFPGSVHVSEVGFSSESDLSVWEFARHNGYVIASKDSDLSEINVLKGFPPSVIWIRRGNCSTKDIEMLFRENSEALESLDQEASGRILILY